MIPCRRFHRFGEGATEYITIAEFALFGDRQLEAEVRWAVADRDAAAEAARGRERQAEEGGRRSEPRQGVQGSSAEDFEAVRKRKLVDAVCGEWDVSIIRWACRRRRAEPSVAPALSMSVRSTGRDGGLWRAAIESKAVIAGSDISLDYSDLAKVLRLIGALTCYSWVCFEQAKADQSELNT